MSPFSKQQYQTNGQQISTGCCCCPSFNGISSTTSSPLPTPSSSSDETRAANRLAWLNTGCAGSSYFGGIIGSSLYFFPFGDLIGDPASHLLSLHHDNLSQLILQHLDQDVPIFQTTISNKWSTNFNWLLLLSFV
jgi:hypothetical protein